MKLSKLTLSIGMFIFCATVFAQTPTLPTELKVGTPQYIYSPDNKWAKSYDLWQDFVMAKIKNDEFGPTTQTVWTAYSDREGNRTYTTPGGATSSASQYKTLGFMNKVYIAEVRNGYAHVFEDDYTVVYPKINPTAKSLGWISVDNLLLWDKCPLNQNNIYQKALVVGDPKKSTNIKQNPPFIKAPSEVGGSDFKAKNLDILFIMKKAGDFYLLSKEMSIKSKPYEVYGWLNDVYITFWDQRLCIEPTSNRDNVDFYKSHNLFPSVYKEEFGASSFYTQNTTGTPFWKYGKMSTERMNSYVMRSPLLSAYGNEIYKVATYASLKAEGENLMGDIIEDVEQGKESEKTVNVIFVIAATASMKKHYTSVAIALDDVMRRSWDVNNVKAGVVLYRSSADGENEIEYLKCGNMSSAMRFIDDHTGDLYSKGPTAYASLYKGLETALDTKKMAYQSAQSNFIILIGDTGNEAKADATMTISQKMKDNRINFLAFQVNNIDGYKAYSDFALQVLEIADQTANLRTPTVNGQKDVEFKLQKNRLYLTERRNKERADINTLIFSGYQLADAGKTESIVGLKDLLTTNVVEYINRVEEKIEFVAKSESGVMVDEVALREILIDYGWNTANINSYFEDLRKGGVTKLIGFAPMKIKSAGDKQIFDFMLFFSYDELDNLVKELKKLQSSNISNRKAFQDAVITMGQAILGQMTKEDIQEMSIDQMVNQIYGVPIQMKACGVNIEDIIDLYKVSDNQLLDIINQFNTKLDALERIKNSSTYAGKFKTNGITYIWVPLSDMPGYCR